MDTFYCRECGIGFWSATAEDAASEHGNAEHAFVQQARIDEQVTDPHGKTAQVVQVIEDGEVGVVRYADGSEDEWDMVELDRV
jgi:hypothetical protein